MCVALRTYCERQNITKPNEVWKKKQKKEKSETHCETDIELDPLRKR